jgi:MYXO-CTERM domain-containing protein
MNDCFGRSTRRSGFRLVSLSALAACLALSAANGQIVSLHDGNSDATIDLGSQAGMSAWRINGQNQLNQQWFWYRVDGDPTGQHSIDTIGGLSFANNANSLSANYNTVAFGLSLTYQLSGGLAGGSDWTSDIGESITIFNHTTSPLSFHFFQYSDFRLAGSIGGETATIYQSGGFFSKAKVIKGANQVSETVDQPLADHAEADLTYNTLSRLNQGSPYTLNDNLSAGPDPGADATWALEWDFTIGANSSVDVLKDKRLSVTPIPEPGVAALALVGLAGLAFRRNRR